MNAMIPNLITWSLIIGVVALLFWPGKGLFWQVRRNQQKVQRILIEDALKHLYDQEYKGLKCTLQSISGALSLSVDKTAALLTRLEELGLVQAQGDGVDLTAEGRSYALKMVRIHRLWERYLADETGMKETEWHRKAEKLEHQISEKEAEAMAASMGHPTYDPHGDPIPTRSGKLPPKKGKPLTDLEVNEVARIIHVEDEPDAIYAQLVAEGLHPGMQIRLLEKEPNRLYFVAEGEEVVLAPVMAANITVEPLPRASEKAPPDSLATLQVGERAEVLRLSPACRGQQRRRLMDLGIVPGTVISVEMRSPAGDPRAYNIRGATIALRKNQAELIHVRRMKEAA